MLSVRTSIGKQRHSSQSAYRFYRQESGLMIATVPGHPVPWANGILRNAIDRADLRCATCLRHVLLGGLRFSSRLGHFLQSSKWDVYGACRNHRVGHALQRYACRMVRPDGPSLNHAQFALDNSQIREMLRHD